MTVWEMVILMVVAGIVISGGFSFVYQSIVSTIERYQIRKTKRSLEIYAAVMKEFPEVISGCITKMKELEKD